MKKPTRAEVMTGAASAVLSTALGIVMWAELPHHHGGQSSGSNPPVAASPLTPEASARATVPAADKPGTPRRQVVIVDRPGVTRSTTPAAILTRRPTPRPPASTAPASGPPLPGPQPSTSPKPSPSVSLSAPVPAVSTCVSLVVARTCVQIGG